MTVGPTQLNIDSEALLGGVEVAAILALAKIGRDRSGSDSSP
jgi:hypothetical protein